MKKFKKSLAALLVSTSFATTLVFTSCKSTKSFTISYDENGASEIEDSTVKDGTEFELPTISRDGYAFEGWYDASGNKVTKVTVTENLTVTAKWTKLQVVTLDLDGGTLSDTTISVKVGDNLLSVLSNYKPTKSNVEFAAWYLNGEAVSSTYVMPENDITLVAKYQASYTAKYYKQNKNGGYDETTENGKAIVGSTYTSTQTFEGYTEVTKDDSVTSFKVSEDSSKNQIKQYFDIETFTYTFNTNYPGDLDNTETTVTAQYQEEFTLPEVSCDDYVLLGWSTTPNGEVKYSVNSLESKVYGTDVKPETYSITATGNETLYAVWSAGYSNMFEGDDKIYLLSSDSDTVYLNRGGVIFKGTYKASKKEFKFYTSDGDTQLTGKLYDNGTFAYESEERASKSYAQYIPYVSTNTGVTIYLDEYSGLTYAAKGEDGVQTTSEGEYVVNEDGTYTVTFTDGDLAGTKMSIKLLSSYFVIMDEDTVCSNVPYYAVQNGVFDAVAGETLTLDGYYTATLGSTSYTYYVKDGLIYLVTSGTSSSTIAKTLKITEIDGVTAVVDYSSTYDFEAVYGNNKLTLDGTATATYSENGVVVAEGYYSLSKSYITGNLIVSFSTEFGDNYKFEVVSNTITGLDGTSTTSYSFNQLYEGYTEYIYQNVNGYYYYPLIVIDGEGTASLYALEDGATSSNRVFVKVSSGTIEKVNGEYVYTATTFETTSDIAESDKVGINPTLLTSVKFTTTTYSSFNVAVYNSYTYKDDVSTPDVNEAETISNLTTYKGTVTITADSATIVYNITLVNNKVGTTTITMVPDDTSKYKTFTGEVGTYSTSTSGSSKGITTVKCTSIGLTLYVELTEPADGAEAGTFTQVINPYTQYLYKDGKTDQTEYFSFDRYSKMKYVKTTQDENGKDVLNSYEGTVTLTTNTTTAGAPIYSFTSTDGTISFEFISLSSSSATYFAKYNKDEAKTYKYSENNEITIVLDGCGMYATLSNGTNSRTFNYTITTTGTETAITLSNSSSKMVCVVGSDGETFTIPSSERGTYLAMNNSSFTGQYIYLDGFGNAKQQVSSNGSLVDGLTGTYTIDEETSLVTIKFADNDKLTFVGRLSIVTISSKNYYAFEVVQDINRTLYVNPDDHTIIMIDEFNNATYYNEQGVKLEGDFRFITEDLIYFVDSSATTAGVYKLNNETGTVVKMEYSKSIGYFTSDFESLLFYNYGYVSVNGSTAYYTISGTTANIYVRDIDSDDANKYGYVLYKEVELGNNLEFLDKSWIKNTGYSVQFVRDSETIDEFKFNDGQISSLTFTPSGKTFTTTGTMVLTGSGSAKSYNVTVSRVQNDNGQYVMSVTYGAYTWTIDATYAGVDEDDNSLSTFTITALKQQYTFYNYNVINLAAMYYQYGYGDLSYMIPNYGSISIVRTFDKDGNTLTDNIVTDFEKAEITDLAGNVLEFTDAKYSLGSSSTILITGTAKDGVEYTYVFQYQQTTVGSNSYLGFALLYATRNQTLTYTSGDNTYTVYTEQIVNYAGKTSTADSDYGEYIGMFAGMGLKVNGVDANVTDIYEDDDTHELYAVCTTTSDDGKITLNHLYKFALVSETLEEGSTAAAKYVSVTVEESTKYAYYNSTTTSATSQTYIFVDTTNNTIKDFCYEGTSLVIKTQSYNEATKTYTVTTTKKQYTITINTDGTVTIVKSDLTTETN